MHVNVNYKCRQCDKVFHHLGAPEGLRVMLHVINNTPLPPQWGPWDIGLLELHHCGPTNETMGLADFIGVTPAT